MTDTPFLKPRSRISATTKIKQRLMLADVEIVNDRVVKSVQTREKEKILKERASYSDTIFNDLYGRRDFSPEDTLIIVDSVS